MDGDKTAQAVELAAHKRRLMLLQERSALMGISVDPSVTVEIEDIQKRIAEIEKSGVTEQDGSTSQGSIAPWWDMLPRSLSQVEGDVIIATIGAGAQGVAVGKHIQQTLNTALGPPTPSDRQIIEQGMAEMRAVFDQMRGQIDPGIVMMTDFQFKLLADELAKTDATQIPSASAIVQIGDWLFEHLPQLGARITGLFAMPAVGRVLSKAGEPALSWTQRRLK